MLGVPGKAWILFSILLAAAPAACVTGSASASCDGRTPDPGLTTKPFRHSPEAAVRLEEIKGEKPLELKVSVCAQGMEIELPPFYGSTQWPLCNIVRDLDGKGDTRTIIAGEFSRRGREDLAVVGECMTTIGPTGAEPFLAGSIYRADEGMHLLADNAASEHFTSLLQTRCMAETLGDCDLAGLAQSAVRATP
jgi:hypothetical protein